MPRTIRYWYSIVSETDLLLSGFCLVGVAPWYQTGTLRAVKYVHFISQFPAQLLEYTGFVVSVTYFASKNQFFERFSIFLKIYSLLQDQSFQTIFTKWQIVSVFQAKVGSRGYHVYKETTWRNTMENGKITVAIE